MELVISQSLNIIRDHSKSIFVMELVLRKSFNMAWNIKNHKVSFQRLVFLIQLLVNKSLNAKMLPMLLQSDTSSTCY
jgi:hypothetical protein